MPEKRRRFLSWRRLVLLLVVAGIVGLVVMALAPSPIEVDVGQVQRGPMRVTVDAEGKTRLRHRYIVSAPVAGRLDRLDLRPGDRVEEGQVIARLDHLPTASAVREAQARLAELRAQRAGVATLRPKRQALAQAQARIAAAQAVQRSAAARVEQARAALEQAERERQRAERLQAVGAIAQEVLEIAQLTETSRRKEFEAARLEAQGAVSGVQAAQAALALLEAEQRDPDYLLDVYDARIASVEAELSRLQDEAARTDIIAPVSGQVLRVMQENERVLAAGTPVLEIGNLRDLELIVDVLSTDAVRVHAGDRVIVEHWGGEGRLEARVRLIEPAAFTEVSALGVEEQRVNVIADFVETPVPLGDGYRVEARIVVWEAQDVLQVPLSGLFRCGESWCVFGISDDQAQQRTVEIGQRNTMVAEVRQGLTAGEVVILYPSEQIEDGQWVRRR